jgi:uncharacterized iron-regulated membrane protein
MSQPQRGGLYGRIWRWHFFAALLVVPFVLWQSLTGTLYLWHEEIADLAHPRLRFVEPQGTRVSYEQQYEIAKAHHPGESLAFMQVRDDPRRSTLFSFSASNGLVHPAFVDPYTGAYLGSVPPTQWLPGFTRSLHGGWPINPWGSYLLELGASWGIVMILTGLYLWWPREAQGAAGVLYPRLRSGSRIFWRDLHSVVGVYFAVIVLLFLFTALPWTSFWGEKLLRPIQQATGQVAPTAAFFGGGHHGSHAAHAPPPAGPALDLESIVERARAEGARDVLEVWPLASDRPINVRSRLDTAASEVYVRFDRQSGAVLAQARWSDYPVIPKIIATGVDLHEGKFFGRANQIFNTVVASSLVWLAITGFIGWYKRRPRGGLAVPPKRNVALTRGAVGIGAVLCIVLPLLGLSVTAIYALDRIAGRLLPARA